MGAAAEYAAAASFSLTNASAPQVVVALHGLGADREQPLALVEGVLGEDVAVLGPDARAHGRTPVIGAADAFSFPELAADVLALLHRLGQEAKPVHLVGVSMGAAVALRTALDGRLDVRSLTLVRPAFDENPSPRHLQCMAAIGRALRDSPVDVARAQFRASPEHLAVAAVSAAGAASLLAQFDDPLARERSVRLREVPRNTAYASAAELDRVRVPTLVLGAERDPVHPLAIATSWAAGVPAARLVLLPSRDDDPARHRQVTRDTVGGFLAGSLAETSALRTGAVERGG